MACWTCNDRGSRAMAYAETGSSAKRHLSDVLQELQHAAEMLSSSMGPAGADQLLLNEAGQVVVSGAGDVVIKALLQQGGISAQACMILKMVHDSSLGTGDGAKRLMCMVTAGLQQYMQEPIAPHQFHAGFGAQVLQALLPTVTHCQAVSEVAAMRQVLHAALLTCWCNRAATPAAQHLAELLLDLVTQHYQAVQQGTSFEEVLHVLVAQPPVTRVAGLPVSASCLLQGVLISATPAAAAMAMSLPRCQLAVLDCPIDGPGQQPAAHVADPRDAQLLAASADMLQAAAAQSARACKKRFDLLAGRGVRLVLCTHAVSEAAAAAAHAAAIVLVAGLDETEMAQVCQVTGAVPVTRMTLAALAAAQPGHAAGVRAVSLGMRRAMLLQPMIRQGVSTLVVCGPSEGMAQHYAGLIIRGLATLSALPAQATPTRAEAAVRFDAVQGGPEEAPQEALLYMSGGCALESALACTLERCMEWARGLAPVTTTMHQVGEPCVGSASQQEASVDGHGRASSGGMQGPVSHGNDSAEADADEAGSPPVFDVASLVNQLIAGVCQGGRLGALATADELGADELQASSCSSRAQPLPERIFCDSRIAETLSDFKGYSVSGHTHTQSGGLLPQLPCMYRTQVLSTLRVLHSMANVIPPLLAGGCWPTAAHSTSPAGCMQRREAFALVHELKRTQAQSMAAGSMLEHGLLLLRRVTAHLSTSAGSRDPHADAAESSDSDAESASLDEEELQLLGPVHFCIAKLGPSAAGSSSTSTENKQGAGSLTASGAAAFGGMGELGASASTSASMLVVEPASVAATIWTHAVTIVQQVIRIHGPALAATRKPIHAGQSSISTHTVVGASLQGRQSARAVKRGGMVSEGGDSTSSGCTTHTDGSSSD